MNSNQLELNLDEGFTTPLDGYHLRILQAQWLLDMDTQVPQKIVLVAKFGPESTHILAQLFPVLQPLVAKGERCFDLEVAPDVLKVLAKLARKVKKPEDWLRAGDGLLLQLDSYIMLGCHKEPMETGLAV